MVINLSPECTVQEQASRDRDTQEPPSKVITTDCSSHRFAMCPKHFFPNFLAKYQALYCGRHFVTNEYLNKRFGSLGLRTVAQMKLPHEISGCSITGGNALQNTNSTLKILVLMKEWGRTMLSTFPTQKAQNTEFNRQKFLTPRNLPPAQFI